MQPVDVTLGYQILVTGVVPKPATLAMMICDLGLEGASLRRRKTAICFPWSSQFRKRSRWPNGGRLFCAKGIGPTGRRFAGSVSRRELNITPACSAPSTLPAASPLPLRTKVTDKALQGSRTSLACTGRQNRVICLREAIPNLVWSRAISICSISDLRAYNKVIVIHCCLR